jgi:hypothetical protein
MVKRCNSKVGVGMEAAKLAKFESAVTSPFGARINKFCRKMRFIGKYKGVVGNKLLLSRIVIKKWLYIIVERIEIYLLCQFERYRSEIIRDDRSQ